MRFIQLEIQMGSGQRIKCWLQGFRLSGVAAHTCFHLDSDSSRALQPSSHRALALAVLQVFPEMQWHLHPTPRKPEIPQDEARPP